LIEESAVREDDSKNKEARGVARRERALEVRAADRGGR